MGLHQTQREQSGSRPMGKYFLVFVRLKCFSASELPEETVKIISNIQHLMGGFSDWQGFGRD